MKMSLKRAENNEVQVLVEYVPPTKVTRDAESLLIGRIRGNHYTIGTCTPHMMYFEAGGWRGNCAGHLTVGEIKGGQSSPVVSPLVRLVEGEKRRDAPDYLHEAKLEKNRFKPYCHLYGAQSYV
ncbi:hypothetical protein TNCV_4026801 [Trichonephila clavipes]|nr:hypothetical protein TNCV_4026801 [Trichonephila clavipes]